MKLPDFAAAPSSVRFHREIFEEHLEEAAFFYEQRRAAHANPDVAWTDLADVEARLEAHIDALSAGGDLPFDVCTKRAVEGDAGELFAAVCVFCRRLQTRKFAEVLKAIDFDDAQKAAAVSDALKYELPESWREYCSAAAAQPDSKLAPVLAVVLGYRRVQPRQELITALRSAPPAALPELLWSLGRTRTDFATPVVRELLTADDPATAAAAVHAALLLHDVPSASELMKTTKGVVEHPIAIGLAGARRMSKALLRGLKDSEKPRDVLMACGLLGDIGIIRPLLDLLSDADVASGAAQALHVMTGAPLYEVVLIPDPVDETELSDGELAAFREHGELPRRPDGEPFGTRVRQLSQDPSAWQAWLDANASRFRPGARYRLGALYSPQVLLDCLRSRTYPKDYRRWAGDELLIRYGVDLPLEVDMRVAQQIQLLDRAAGSVARATAAFQEGQWYFAGEVVTS
jgi:uncharacterized protein (TIGR02270 family)